MDELLNLFHDVTGTMYDGEMYGYDAENNEEDMPGFDNESDIDEDVVVEGAGEDDDNSDDGSSSNEGEEEEQRGRRREATILPQWTTLDGFDGAVGPQHFDFSERIGLTDDADVNCFSTSFDFFSLFITPELLEEIRDQTNLYAEWRQEREGRVDKYWKPVTTSDMRIYIATQFMMGIHQLPEYSMIWSSDDRLRVPGIADPMGKSRYEKIHQYFHLNNPAHEIPRGQDGHDPLYKVRPLISHIQQSCQKLYAPGQCLSIDEAMIGFRGRLHFLQYMRGKPTPWGIKVWCLADPTNGYMSDFNIYCGRSATPNPKGLGYDVVTTLSDRFLDKGYHLFYDNFFASVTLSRDLLERHTHSCSTIRTNRIGWPAPLKERATTKMKKGEVRCCQSNGLTATVWRDKRKVSVLSTNVTPLMKTVRRRAPGGSREVDIPSPVLAYNHSMFGVDLADQHRSYYGMGRSGMKWWRYVAWFLFQIAMINSWILFKIAKRPHPKNRRLMSQIQFRLDVCAELVRGCKSRKRRAQDNLPATVGLANTHAADHQVIRIQGLKKSCVECGVNGRKTPKGFTPTSVYGCSLCKVHLCKGHCYAAFHIKLGVHV